MILADGMTFIHWSAVMRNLCLPFEMQILRLRCRFSANVEVKNFYLFEIGLCVSAQSSLSRSCAAEG